MASVIRFESDPNARRVKKVAEKIISYLEPFYPKGLRIKFVDAYGEDCPFVVSSYEIKKSDPIFGVFPWGKRVVSLSVDGSTALTVWFHKACFKREEVAKALDEALREGIISGVKLEESFWDD